MFYSNSRRTWRIDRQVLGQSVFNHIVMMFSVLKLWCQVRRTKVWHASRIRYGIWTYPRGFSSCRTYRAIIPSSLTFSTSILTRDLSDVVFHNKSRDVLDLKVHRSYGEAKLLCRAKEVNGICGVSRADAVNFFNWYHDTIFKVCPLN